MRSNTRTAGKAMARLSQRAAQKILLKNHFASLIPLEQLFCATAETIKTLYLGSLWLTHTVLDHITALLKSSMHRLVKRPIAWKVPRMPAPIAQKNWPSSALFSAPYLCNKTAIAASCGIFDQIMQEKIAASSGSSRPGTKDSTSSTQGETGSQDSDKLLMHGRVPSISWKYTKAFEDNNTQTVYPQILKSSTNFGK